MTSSLDLSQFFGVFFEESEDLLAEMESLLLAIDISSPDKEECNAIFRCAHSIKGGAATFGLADMVELAHIMESLLDRIRKGNMKLDEGHLEAFLKAKDILKEQLYAHNQHQPLDSAASKDVLALLRYLSSQDINGLANGDRSVFTTAKTTTNKDRPDIDNATCYLIELPTISADDLNALVAELRLKGNLSYDELTDGKGIVRLETTETMDDLVAICSFLLNPEDIHIIEAAIQPNVSGATERFPLGKNNGTVPANGLTTATTNPTPAPAVVEPTPNSPMTVGQDTTNIRVKLEKVDQLINLVGELVITKAMIEQQARSLDSNKHKQLLTHIDTLARDVRDLQDSVMSIRLMPMELVFSRFPRMVRELAGKLGKKAKLVTVGGATELDKGLIERIIDPMVHLVRNSIDHGLEEPTIRLANNKPETGTITLSAIHEGGHIILQIIDDGAGLNRGKIIKKAKDWGISVSGEISDNELWDILSTPGFTTASSITDISGRGVGMDVVKRNIAAMGGSVHIESTWGLGTTVTISLPLTLAILDGMSIKTGEEIYIIPLLTVVESLHPNPEQIYEITGKGKVICVRDEYIPMIILYDLFHIQPRSSNPTDGIIVVVEDLGKKAALLVDSLVGQQQVVVKNLEVNYRRMPGISGATILGDGHVSLILDVPSLMGMCGQ